MKAVFSQSAPRITVSRSDFHFQEERVSHVHKLSQDPLLDPHKLVPPLIQVSRSRVRPFQLKRSTRHKSLQFLCHTGDLAVQVNPESLGNTCNECVYSDDDEYLDQFLDA